MPFKQLKEFFTASGARLPREDALKVFRRDHFKCKYCGLDGLHSFESWLALTIDYVHPSAQGGPRTFGNLVTACQPCNVIKGKRVFKSFEEAKHYVKSKREEWRQVFIEQVKLAGAAKTAR